MLGSYYQPTFLALLECAEEEVEVLELDMGCIVCLDKEFENCVCSYHCLKRSPEQGKKNLQTIFKFSLEKCYPGISKGAQFAFAYVLRAYLRHI